MQSASHVCINIRYNVTKIDTRFPSAVGGCCRTLPSPQRTVRPAAGPHWDARQITPRTLYPVSPYSRSVRGFVPQTYGQEAKFHLFWTWCDDGLRGRGDARTHTLRRLDGRRHTCAGRHHVCRFLQLLRGMQSSRPAAVCEHALDAPHAHAICASPASRALPYACHTRPTRICTAHSQACDTYTHRPCHSF